MPSILGTMNGPKIDNTTFLARLIGLGLGRTFN